MVPFVPGPTYKLRPIFAFAKTVIEKADLMWLDIEKLAVDLPQRVQILEDNVTFIGPVSIRPPYNPRLGPFQHLPQGRVYNYVLRGLLFSVLLVTSTATLIFSIVIQDHIKKRLLLERQERREYQDVGWLARTFVKIHPIACALITGVIITSIPPLVSVLTSTRKPMIEFYEWPFTVVRIT